MKLLQDMQILETLGRQGWVHLPNQKVEDCKNMLQSLGKIIQETDVIVKPESKAMITSPRALDLHTDHHRADYILWYCLQQTSEGGDSLLLDMLPIYTQLAENEQETLQTVMLMEHKVFPDDVEQFPLVRIEAGKPKFYYSFWLVKENILPTQKQALDNFRTCLQNALPTQIRLEKGDILIVDNRRVLHGRTAITGSQDRFLKRFWIEKRPQN
jgi:alpha-ketoglutarate-dependent taurine dioxygenase